MVKAKWGTKRTCPKCGTRFYDLGKEKPVVCIECENEWVPEPILKSRQPQMEEEKDKEEEEAEDEKEAKEDEVVKEALAVDDNAEGNPDDDIDLGDGSDVPEVITPTKPTKDGA